jgi:hypothetical protein
MAKVVIDRAKWRQGALLDDEGRRCAFGWLLKELGAPDEELVLRNSIFGNPSIIDLLSKYDKGFDAKSKDDLMWHQKVAYSVNDNSNISVGFRESSLIALFAEKNHDLSFEGEYRP